jgi:hypothetical protein
LYTLYHRLWPGETPNSTAHIVAFRYLEDLFQRVFVGAKHPIRLIFVFDEFEKMLRELPPRFFQSLRSLRDQYKDRVMYITTARQILPLLVPEELYPEYEPFIDLFVDTRHFLLPYRPSDAEQTFQRLSTRQDYSPPPVALREQLLMVTGGHAGLLRAAFAAWEPENLIDEGMSDTDLVATLLSLPSIQEECRTIWRSLSEAEQRILFDMVRAQHHRRRTNVSPMNPMAGLLIRKGILLETNNMAFENVRPLVFAGFLLSVIPAEAPKGGSPDQMPDFPQRPHFS